MLYFFNYSLLLCPFFCVCTFEEVGTSSSFYRLDSVDKALYQSVCPEIWVGHLVMTTYGLAAGVLEWPGLMLIQQVTGLVLGSVKQAWSLGSLGHVWCLNLWWWVWNSGSCEWICILVSQEPTCHWGPLECAQFQEWWVLVQYSDRLRV